VLYTSVDQRSPLHHQAFEEKTGIHVVLVTDAEATSQSAG